MKPLGDIIKKVQMTEKGSGLTADNNQYLLQVALTANKVEIRRAVEELFSVKVTSVNTMRYTGKTRVLRNRRTAKRPDWKRAVVTLKTGDQIELV